MANKPITLKRNNSGTVDNLYPKTTWDQIETTTIPDDFNPSSHTHGYINNSGQIGTSQTIATGDHLVIADNSASNALVTSTITFDTTNTTAFLRADGTFATPAGSTFNGGTITNNLISEALIQIEDPNDSDYARLTHYGIEFNRAASYLRPTSNGTYTLYIGQTAGNFPWDTIRLDADNKTIIPTGNVGIGTDSPSELLEVEGSGTTRLAVTSTGGATLKLKAASGNAYISTSTNDNIIFQINDASQHIFNTAGNVGIGTTSPSYGLDVHANDGQIRAYGTTGKVWAEASDSGQASFELKNTEGHFRFITDNGEYYIYDQTDSAERFRISTAGNTTVSGNLTVSSAYPRIYLTDTDSDSDYSVLNGNGYFSVYDDTNSAFRLRIDSSGTTYFYNDIAIGNNTLDFNANSGDSVTAQLKGDRSATDLDTRNFTTEGGFSYTTFDGSTSNKPGGSFNNANGLLTMNTHSGAYNWQLAFVNTQGKMYARYRNGGSFQSWNEILTSASGYATESYVDTEISNLVDSAPGALNTLNELAAALGDDENFSTTVTNSIATKLPLAGGTLTGTLTSRAINMQNYNLSNVGALSFNDPGPNEGISWSGGNFKIYESPNDLSTNSSGNLQFVSGGSRRLTVQTDGTVYVPGTLKAEKVEIEGALFDVETNSLKMPLVKGGHYNSDTSSVTGAISIVLPTGTYANATMMNFFVDVFDYAGGSDGESFTLHIGGYNYTDGTWHNVFANLISGRTDRFFTVRFNYDSTNSANIIYIGETTSNWAYPKVTVRDFSAGFSGADDADWYNNSFTVSITSTMFGTTSRSKTAENVASYALNADKLDDIQATSFLRSDSDDSYNGTLSLGSTSTIKLPNSAQYGIRTSTGHRVIDSVDATLRIGDVGKHSLITLHGQDNDDFKVYYNSTHYTIYHEGNKPSAGDVGAAAANHTHSDLVAVSGDTMTGDLTMASDGESTANDSHGVILTARFNSTPFTRKLYMDDEANLLFGTNTIFHSGNDGSASGLHADLLDGQQGSHYLDYNNFTNTPTIPTNNNQLTNGAGYVTGSHSHSTSNITSGEFNTARLGSGTATSGYVLQSDGDGTASWAASSGGGEYEWEYVAVVKDSNTLTYSSMDDANYDYKFVIHCQATATEDTSQPYIRINGDSASSEYSYQYQSVTQTSETGETVLNAGDALTSLIYTGADLSSYSNGGSSFSTVHTAEVIVQHSPWSTYPGNYTLVLRGWAQTHYVSQSGSSYDGMVQSTFVGTKDNLYGPSGENHRFDYTHNIAGSSTNYRIMRVYRRERK